MEHGYWSLLALVAATMFMFRWFQEGDGRGRRRKRREIAGLEEEDRQQLLAQSGRAEALETRVAELENRLDFTERLLAGRRETPLREVTTVEDATGRAVGLGFSCSRPTHLASRDSPYRSPVRGVA